MSASPRLLLPVRENFLAVLLAARGWLFTVPTWDEKKQRWGKPPYSPHTGRQCDKRNPASWGTASEALAAMERFGGAAVGISLSAFQGLLAIDLDNCRRDYGEIDAWAKTLVREVDTYAEVSPSRTGIRMLVWGTRPAGAGTVWRLDGHKVEVLGADQWVTITGYWLPGTPFEIRERSDALSALWERCKPPAPAIISREIRPSAAQLIGDDAEAVSRLSRMFRDEFERLWRGDLSDIPLKETGERDKSVADHRLCWYVACLVGADRARIDRLWRQSGLARDSDRLDKWNSARGSTTYGAITIDSVLRRQSLKHG